MIQIAPNRIVKATADRLSYLDRQIAKGEITLRSVIKRYVYPVTKDSLGFATVSSVDSSAVDEVNKAITWIITTADSDRDGDVVNPMGLNLENYRNNPIWFFGHQEKPWEIPIGTTMSSDGELCVWPEKLRATAKVFYDQHDPDAMFIYDKCCRKLINATSIAFVPLVAHSREYEYKAQHQDSTPLGFFFEEIDLTEISNVAIPANAGAIRDALDSEKSFITPRLQKALRPYAAQAKGRCFSGWCPCPPCEENGMISKRSSANESIETPYGLEWRVRGGGNGRKWFSTEDERSAFLDKLAEKYGGYDVIDSRTTDPQKSLVGRALCPGCGGPAKVSKDDAVCPACKWVGSADETVDSGAKRNKVQSNLNRPKPAKGISMASKNRAKRTLTGKLKTPAKAGTVRRKAVTPEPPFSIFQGDATNESSMTEISSGISDFAGAKRRAEASTVGGYDVRVVDSTGQTVFAIRGRHGKSAKHSCPKCKSGGKPCGRCSKGQVRKDDASDAKDELTRRTEGALSNDSIGAALEYLRSPEARKLIRDAKLSGSPDDLLFKLTGVRKSLRRKNQLDMAAGGVDFPDETETKEVSERQGRFYVQYPDGTERGPFASEEEAMVVHSQPDEAINGKAMNESSGVDGGYIADEPANSEPCPDCGGEPGNESCQLCSGSGEIMTGGDKSKGEEEVPTAEVEVNKAMNIYVDKLKPGMRFNEEGTEYTVREVWPGRNESEKWSIICTDGTVFAMHPDEYVDSAKSLKFKKQSLKGKSMKTRIKGNNVGKPARLTSGKFSGSTGTIVEDRGGSVIIRTRNEGDIEADSNEYQLIKSLRTKGQPKFKPGDKVQDTHENVSGTVINFELDDTDKRDPINFYHVRLDDGTEVECMEDDLRRKSLRTKGQPKFKPGDKVRDTMQNKNGMVMTFNGDSGDKRDPVNTYTVHFDDGTDEECPEFNLRRKSLRTKGQEETPTVEVEEKDEPAAVPPMAKFMATAHDHLKNLDEWAEKELPQHEPEAKEHYADLHQDLKDLIGKHAEKFESRYPDHKMEDLAETKDEDPDEEVEMDEDEDVEKGDGGEDEMVANGDVPEGEEVEDEKEEGSELAEGESPMTDEATEEILERYQRAKRQNKALRNRLRTKGMSCTKDHADTLTEASEHMKSLSDAPDLPKHHAAGLEHHADALDGIVKELADGGAEDVPTAEVEVNKRLRRKAAHNYESMSYAELTKVIEECKDEMSKLRAQGMSQGDHALDYIYNEMVEAVAARKRKTKALDEDESDAEEKGEEETPTLDVEAKGEEETPTLEVEEKDDDGMEEKSAEIEVRADQLQVGDVVVEGEDGGEVARIQRTGDGVRVAFTDGRNVDLPGGEILTVSKRLKAKKSAKPERIPASLVGSINRVERLIRQSMGMSPNGNH